jgi:hypothetical protein
MVPLRTSARISSLSGIFAFQIGFHGSLVGLDGSLDQQFAVLLGLVLEISRDFDNVPLRAEDSSRQTMPSSR